MGPGISFAPRAFRTRGRISGWVPAFAGTAGFGAGRLEVIAASFRIPGRYPGESRGPTSRDCRMRGGSFGTSGSNPILSLVMAGLDPAICDLSASTRRDKVTLLMEAAASRVLGSSPRTTKGEGMGFRPLKCDSWREHPSSVSPFGPIHVRHSNRSPSDLPFETFLNPSRGKGKSVACRFLRPPLPLRERGRG